MKHCFRKIISFTAGIFKAFSPTLVELFESQGIHSTLQCAFYDNGIFRGFIGFDECTGSRFWTREEVSSLSLISQILATFLKLNRMEAENPCQRMTAVAKNTEKEREALPYETGTRLHN